LRGSVVYSYDRSGYLTGRSGQMYDHDRYYYDKAGNLLDNEGQGPVMSNRLPGCGRDRYGYNEWGELTTRRDQQLEWNAQGQLTRVISGNTETHYGYDALGRRTRKATYGRHTGHTARSRTDFVWEGFRLLQENVQQQGWRTYLYDAEQPYTPVASVTGKGESRQVWYYHTDVTGTPQEVTAADGTLVWAGYIRGFGENAADISNSGAYFHQPLRLPGQYFDDETGLHYNLFRYYAPECGRFVSQDPIGLRGGLNLYQYAPNPIRWIDPLGLYNGEDIRTPGEYTVYYQHQLPTGDYTKSDDYHFKNANEGLYNAMNQDPQLRASLERRYPGIYEHVSPGARNGYSSEPPRGTTWHHANQPGSLELVDFEHHRKYSKIYHPDGTGGRNKWGGGSGCR
ncbi:TPA: RHS repeat protein, partial [Salmonella enterica]|nr:RHS repeat protein [Salmonella enterica]